MFHVKAINLHRQYCYRKECGNRWCLIWMAVKDTSLFPCIIYVFSFSNNKGNLQCSLWMFILIGRNISMLGGKEMSFVIVYIFSFFSFSYNSLKRNQHKLLRYMYLDPAGDVSPTCTFKFTDMNETVVVQSHFMMSWN
jgi:hypothetical protein